MNSSADNSVGNAFTTLLISIMVLGVAILLLLLVL